MNKPVGGRGKKAPYKSVTIRVPEPIAEYIYKYIDYYRAIVLKLNKSGEKLFDDATTTLYSSILTEEEVLRICRLAKSKYRTRTDTIYEILKQLFGHIHFSKNELDKKYEKNSGKISNSE